MRILMGILAGAAGSGVMLALAYYFIAMTDTSTESPIGSVPDWKWVILAIGAMVGALLGGVAGGTIAGLQANFFQAILIGFFLNLAVGAVFFVWSGGPLG